jgi:hypothetical protein
MNVFWLVADTIAMMRCAECREIMNQGERERNPRTETGQPIHQTCKDKASIKP